MRYLLLLFTSSILSLSLFGQTKITGIVKDTKDNPLPGVNVIVKGTSTGTTSDKQGKYVITVPQGAKILQFSYIGYLTKEVDIARQTTIEVTLEEDAIGLEDVVVIGYGTMRRKDLTGAISSIGEKELSDRIMPSVDDALKGMMAGVLVKNSDGSPGGGTSIQIRGIGTITGNTDPLYVIDGVPIDNSSIEDRAQGVTASNPMSMLNPNEIVDIQVLKDASSTAIYGARAANGVIIITTRQGQVGTPRVTLTTRTGVSYLPKNRKIELMNTVEYARFRNQRQPTEAKFKEWWNWADSTYTDWQDVMSRVGMTKDYQLSVSGGNRNTTYAITLGFYQEDGIIVSTDFKRYNGRFNFSHQLTKKLKLNNNFSYARTIQDGIFTGITGEGLINQIIQYTPYTGVYNADGDLNLNDDADPTDQSPINPYVQALTTTRTTTTSSAMYSSNLQWDIAKGLKWNFRPGLDYRLVEQNNFWPSTSNAGREGIAGDNGGYARKTNSSSLHWVLENLLTYDYQIAPGHNLNAMVGFSMEHTEIKQFAAEVQDFPIDYLGADYITAGLINKNNTSSIDESAIVSSFGRINYNIKEKYLFTASLRADASSRFSGKNKWGYFPSGAFKWRISEENFMRNIHFIQDLSLRLSVGATGNQAIPSYRTLPSSIVRKTPFDDNVQMGLVYNWLANPNLKWETTIQYNTGLDVGFFRNRLYVNMDLYYKKTKDMLMNRPVERNSGYVSYMDNIGAIENKGLEISVKSVNFNRKFNWTTQFNISFNRNKVLKLVGDELILDPRYNINTLDESILQVGRPVGQWYGYKTDGIWASWEEILASGITDSRGAILRLDEQNKPIEWTGSAAAQNNLSPGMIKYVDKDGNHIIDAEDRMVLGCGLPNFTGSISNSFAYAGFSLSFMFSFSYGAENLNANLVTLTNLQQMYNKVKAANDFSYKNEAGEFVIGKYPMVRYPATWDILSNYVEDASFLRLSNLTFGYEFNRNAKWMQKARIKGLKIYLTGSNLWLWTKYTGYDPEVTTGQAFETGGTSKYLCPGLDYGAYPASRSWAFGLNITF